MTADKTQGRVRTQCLLAFMWWPRAVLEMQGRAGQGGLAARVEGVECVFDTMWNAQQTGKTVWVGNE